MIPCGGIKIRFYFNSLFEMKLYSELQMCFFYAALSFLCPPSTGAATLPGAAPALVSSARCRSDEILKGGNPVRKLLGRLRVAAAPVQAVTGV